MKELESAIITEAKEVAKRPDLKLKDLLEWSTSEAPVRKNAKPDEQVFYLPGIAVWVCLSKPEA